MDGGGSRGVQVFGKMLFLDDDAGRLCGVAATGRYPGRTRKVQSIQFTSTNDLAKHKHLGTCAVYWGCRIGGDRFNFFRRLPRGKDVHATAGAP
jgi:hypothetical protein